MKDCIDKKRLEESLELTLEEERHLKQCAMCRHIREETRAMRMWLTEPFDPVEEFDPEIAPPPNPGKLIENLWPEVLKMAEEKRTKRQITIKELRERIHRLLKRPLDEGVGAGLFPGDVEAVMAYMEDLDEKIEMDTSKIEQELVQKGCSPGLAKELVKRLFGD